MTDSFHTQQQALASLQEAAGTVLRTTPAGLSEMALLKTLQAPPWEVLTPVDFSSPTALYPAHFLLFHVLYHWRDELHEAGRETLDIGPLHIGLRRLGEAQQKQPGPHDALAGFYQDLSNLALPEAQIDRMLNDFWRGLQPPASDALARACQTLEVAHPPRDLPAVRSQFRRLAMRHHPDRGGNTQQLQALNNAMAVLKQHFRHQG